MARGGGKYKSGTYVTLFGGCSFLQLAAGSRNPSGFFDGWGKRPESKIEVDIPQYCRLHNKLYQECLEKHGARYKLCRLLRWQLKKYECEQMKDAK